MSEGGLGIKITTWKGFLTLPALPYLVCLLPKDFFVVVGGGGEKLKFGKGILHSPPLFV